MPPEVGPAVAEAAREHGGRLIALLAHRFGDLDLADEVVHEALVEALTAWRTELPQNRAAWLMTVARNRAIDRLRREAAARRRLLAAAPELVGPDAGLTGSPQDRDDEEEPLILDDGTVPDERLRLILLCAHPALDRDAQVALTLRLVGGLTTPEIAAAYLLPEATLAQRIVRAKRTIRVAGIPLSIPAELHERADAVRTVLALIFNEGYLARGATAGGAVVRPDLAEEAIRLARLLSAQLPHDAETQGLLALLLLQHARRAARVDELGELVLLEQQDRSRWIASEIDEGTAILAAALRRMQPGPWQVQALIAARHTAARTADETDWPAIAALYAQLEAMTGSPVVALNRAVAVAMADGPRAGLALLDPLTAGSGSAALERYHLLHATRGELLLRLGHGASGVERAAAVSAFERALPLTANPAERRHLERRLALARARASREG